MTATLTVLSGPSGVGKDTMLTAVAKRCPEVWVSRSATTRAPRPGESEGHPYYFMDRATFAQHVADGDFLEHAEYAGNLYGTLRQPVQEHLAAGTSVLLKIDLQGARQVKAAMPTARLLFLAPPSWAELERRLVGRGTEPDEVIAQRLAQASTELAAAPEFDVVVVNDDVKRAADELVELLRTPILN